MGVIVNLICLDLCWEQFLEGVGTVGRTFIYLSCCADDDKFLYDEIRKVIVDLRIQNARFDFWWE